MTHYIFDYYYPEENRLLQEKISTIPELLGFREDEVKKYLNEILQAELEPIRNRRKEFEKDIPEVYKILREGSDRARKVAAQTLKEVRETMGIEYFNNL